MQVLLCIPRPKWAGWGLTQGVSVDNLLSSAKESVGRAKPLRVDGIPACLSQVLPGQGSWGERGAENTQPIRLELHSCSYELPSDNHTPPASPSNNVFVCGPGQVWSSLPSPSTWWTVEGRWEGVWARTAFGSVRPWPTPSPCPSQGQPVANHCVPCAPSPWDPSCSDLLPHHSMEPVVTSSPCLSTWGPTS
jgi:hypothetical protein